MEIEVVLSGNNINYDTTKNNINRHRLAKQRSKACSPDDVKPPKHTLLAYGCQISYSAGHYEKQGLPPCFLFLEIYEGLFLILFFMN